MNDESRDSLPLAPLAETTSTPQPVPAEPRIPADLPLAEPRSPQPTPAEKPKTSDPAPSARPSVNASSAPDWLPEGRPELEQTLRNLRVWLPFLANPNDRLLQARFSPDDDRIGLTWKISLPKFCWHCGTEQGLTPRIYETVLRSFEYPMGVVAGTAAAALLAILIALFTPFIGIVLFLMVLMSGAAVLWLKSWKEEIRFTLWTCPDHAGPMKAPGMVIDDQHLHVTLGNADLVAATTEEIRERRKVGAGRKALGTKTTTTAAPPTERLETSRPMQPAPRPAATPKPELPPIKLADDD